MIVRFSLIVLLLLSTALAAQSIYKVVDEDGNVTYTDQKPSEDARPIDLPEINVLDGGDVPPVATPRRQSEPSESLEFRIASPEEGEHIFGTGNQLDVVLSANVEMPATAQIVVYINGQAREPVRSMSASFEEIPRGEHTLRAELQTASGRVLATTDSITFYMRQASSQHGRP